jgi:hypothetical protein
MFFFKGFGSSQFHYHVGGAKNTVSIIKTNTNSVFGGFTRGLWYQDVWLSDYNAFIFSLRRNGSQNNQILLNGGVDRSSSYSLNSGNSGPSFGYVDLFISSYSNKYATSNSNICYSFSCPAGIDHIR